MTFNRIEYSVLAVLAALYISTVFRYQTVPKYIFYSTIAFAVSYIIWGIVHHIRARNLHFRIVLEYFLVAVLGIAIVSTLLI